MRCDTPIAFTQLKQARVSLLPVFCAPCCHYLHGPACLYYGPARASDPTHYLQVAPGLTGKRSLPLIDYQAGEPIGAYGVRPGFCEQLG